MTVHEVVIVGSGPAGYTAALYAARAGLKPLVIAGSVTAGGALMNTTEVENYPGFPEGIRGPALMEAMEAQAARFGADLLSEDASSFLFSPEGDSPHRIATASGTTVEARTVILALGAQHRHLGVPGEERLGGRGVSYCGVCDAFFFRGKEVVVVGGGDSALEDATFLARFAERVTILHRRASFRASQAMVERLEQYDNITVQWQTTVDEVLGDDKVTAVRLTTPQGEEVKAVEGVFVTIGHDPRSELLREQVATDAEGYVMVESPRTFVLTAGQQERLPGVFACGDLVDRHYRQAITAAGSGCAAALDAQRYLEAL